MPRKKGCFRCFALVEYGYHADRNVFFDDSVTTKHKMFCNLQMLLNVT